MSDMLTGLVVAATSTPIGSATVADQAAGDTVLVLDDTVDFSTTGGQFTVGDGETPIAYVAMDDEASTLTLEAPLVDSIDAETDILVYPPRIDYTAFVLIDESSDPIPASVPWHLQDALPSGVREEEDREQVRLMQDGDWSWAVFDLVNQPLERASTFIQTPVLSAYRGTNNTVPTDTVRISTNWIVERTNTDVITFDPSNGFWYVNEPGEYQVVMSACWASNDDGRRVTWPVWRRAIGGDSDGQRVSLPSDPAPDFTVQTVDVNRLEAGDAVAMAVFQTSGVNLALRGGAVQPTTTLKIIRVGP